MEPNLHPYPQGVPGDTFTRVLEIFRGAEINWEDAHRLWHFAGYCLSKVDPHPTMRGAPPLSCDGAADALEAAYPAREIQPGFRAEDTKAVPWLQIGLLIFDLIRKYLVK